MLATCPRSSGRAAAGRALLRRPGARLRHGAGLTAVITGTSTSGTCSWAWSCSPCCGTGCRSARRSGSGAVRACGGVGCPLGRAASRAAYPRLAVGGVAMAVMVLPGPRHRLRRQPAAHAGCRRPRIWVPPGWPCSSSWSPRCRRPAGDDPARWRGAPASTRAATSSWRRRWPRCWSSALTSLTACREADHIAAV